MAMAMPKSCRPHAHREAERVSGCPEHLGVHQLPPTLLTLLDLRRGKEMKGMEGKEGRGRRRGREGKDEEDEEEGEEPPFVPRSLVSFRRFGGCTTDITIHAEREVWGRLWEKGKHKRGEKKRGPSDENHGDEGGEEDDDEEGVDDGEPVHLGRHGVVHREVNVPPTRPRHLKSPKESESGA